MTDATGSLREPGPMGRPAGGATVAAGAGAAGIATTASRARAGNPPPGAPRFP